MKCGQRIHSNSIRFYLVHSQAPSWGWQMSRLSWTGSPINLTWTPQPLTPPHPLPKTTNPEQEAGIIHRQAPPHLHCSLCPPWTCLPSATSPPFLFLTLSLDLVQKGDIFLFITCKASDLKLHVGQIAIAMSVSIHTHMYSGQVRK